MRNVTACAPITAREKLLPLVGAMRNHTTPQGDQLVVKLLPLVGAMRNLYVPSRDSRHVKLLPLVGAMRNSYAEDIDAALWGCCPS